MTHPSPLLARARSRVPARLVAASAIAGALALSACSSATGGTGGGSTAGVPEITSSLPAAGGQAKEVTWALYNEPTSLDPIKISDFPPQQVITNVCESMLTLTPDMTIVPNLAESYENPEPTR